MKISIYLYAREILLPMSDVKDRITNATISHITRINRQTKKNLTYLLIDFFICT